MVCAAIQHLVMETNSHIFQKLPPCYYSIKDKTSSNFVVSESLEENTRPRERFFNVQCTKMSVNLQKCEKKNSTLQLTARQNRKYKTVQKFFQLFLKHLLSLIQYSIMPSYNLLLFFLYTVIFFLLSLRNVILTANTSLTLSGRYHDFQETRDFCIKFAISQFS